MIGCASSSPPLTPVAVSHRNSPFLSGASAVPFPNPQPPPTLRLPPRRIGAGARAAYASAAAAERERESEYTATGGGYSYSSSSSSSTSYAYNRISGFAAAAAVASPSLYDVLGLSPSATAAEIKGAYRRLARSCHPDASKGGGGTSASAEQFMRVHAAYATLSDPEKRGEYDRGLLMSPGIRTGPVYQRQASYPGPGGSPSSASSTYSAPTGFPSGFGRRTWETDQCW